MSTASTPTPTPTSASTTPVSSVRYPFLVGGPPGLGLGLFPNYATRAAAQSAGVYVGAYNEAFRRFKRLLDETEAAVGEWHYFEERERDG